MLFRDLSRPKTPRRARQIVETYSGEESDLLKKLFYDSLLAAYTPDEVRGQLAAANLTTRGFSRLQFDCLSSTRAPLPARLAGSKLSS